MSVNPCSCLSESKCEYGMLRRLETEFSKHYCISCDSDPFIPDIGLIAIKSLALGLEEV